MLDFDSFEYDEDFESFEKFRHNTKTGKQTPVKTKDHQIRTARKEKEKVRQAVLAEQDKDPNLREPGE